MADQYSFLPTTQPQDQFDLLTYLSGLSQPVDPSTGTVPGGSTVPGTRPMYTPWDQAGGFGNYFGANAGLFSAGMDILGKGIGAYAGLKSLGIAEDALSLEKKRFKTNLRNQTSSYNTQMRDRIAGRHYATEAERQAALESALLPEQKKRGG